MPETESQNAVNYSGPMMANLLNITPRRLQALAKEGVIPKSGRGQYPLAACIRAYVKYLQNNGGGDSSDPDKLPPFQRRAFFQSEMEKLNLEQKQGELIPRMEHEQDLAAVLKMVAELFDTLPDILERDCGLAPAVLEKMEDRLDSVRRDLHSRLSTESEDDESTVRAGA